MSYNSTAISTKNLTAFWNPEEMESHWQALAPFFSVHAAYKNLNGAAAGYWNWSERAVNECLGACWNMTGKWGARRPITFSRSSFDKKLLREIPKLAKKLNRSNVCCLKDISTLSEKKYNSVVQAIHKALTKISSLRKTEVVEPVLGSKVLHHFFPSLVPVFDEQYVNKGIMQLDDLKYFLETDKEGWCFLKNPSAASGPRMLTYHRYFAYCASEVNETPMKRLNAVRQKFAKAFQKLMPHGLVLDKRSLLWKMDAKIAEYCMLGKAHQSKLI